MSARLTPLMRGDLVGGAVEQLRGYVLARPDDEILPSEADLGGRLGISRTVLREALKHLQAQGLVSLAQGKRARVRSGDPRAAARTLEALLRRQDGALLHLADVRRPLEAEIADLAARRAGPADIEAADRAIRDMEQAGSLAAQIEADLRFHRALAKAAANPIFVLLLDLLADLMRASRQKTLGKHGSRIAVDHHRRILDAVRKRRPARARKEMLDHLRLNLKHLREEAP